MNITTTDERMTWLQAIAQLYQLNNKQTDTLMVMGQLCVSATGCALAERVLVGRIDPIVRSAFIMVSPDYGRQMFDGADRAYLAALRRSCYQYSALDEAQQAKVPSHHQALAEQLIDTWQQLNTQQPEAPLSPAYLKPAYEWFPALLHSRLPEINMDVQQADSLYVQRQRVGQYLAGQGPFEIDRVADVITDDELKQLAVHPDHASVAILMELERRHSSPEVMLEAYLEALFTPDSPLRRIVPTWVQQHPHAFLDRFVTRLDQEVARGRYYRYRLTDLNLYRLLKQHATPEQMVALCLGTKQMHLREGKWVITTCKVGEILDRAKFDPQPGDWGPVVKRIVQHLNSHKNDMTELWMSNTLHDALCFLCHRDAKGHIVEGRMFQNSGLRALTSPQYLDDLMQPVDAHRQVIDLIPDLLSYFEGFVERTNVVSLKTKLEKITAAFDRQRERILKQAAPAARTGPAPLVPDENDIL